jgi:hypothetical protein
MKLTSLINSQNFDTDQSVNISKIHKDFENLKSLKLEPEISKPNTDDKNNHLGGFKIIQELSRFIA